MTFITDIRHFLDERGDLPSASGSLRRRALRLAQLVESGGPLDVGQFRETLVPCTARPHRTPCLGLLWVEKTRDQRIFAWCPACRRHAWAGGPMEPATDDDFGVTGEIN